jgi:hypothetical protein
MPQSSRAPRTPSALPPTDPPLPPSLATDITALSTGEEESKFPTINQRRATEDSLKKALVSSQRSSWATKAGDSPKLRDTIRDLQRFLTALPFPLIKITPVVIARVICKVLATQGVMPTNIVSVQTFFNMREALIIYLLCYQAFDVALLFWRLIINIFFRSVQVSSSYKRRSLIACSPHCNLQPRGSWRIPRPDEGPVIFVGAPHHNQVSAAISSHDAGSGTYLISQFLDGLILASEVRRGSGRRVAFLVAEKSIKRRFIGAAARIMQSSECESFFSS